jgi:hypothetical protein
MTTDGKDKRLEIFFDDMKEFKFSKKRPKKHSISASVT